MTHELYKIHRPKRIEGLFGQPGVVKQLKGYDDRGKSFPHCMGFFGPSGTGKTTTARIIKRIMNVSDQDYVELNAAQDRGIDIVRQIRRQMALAPMGGDHRIWVIDECHSLSKDAMNAILKMLEDTPEHVYFILATTDPEKLIKTIITRCSVFQFQRVTENELVELLEEVCDEEDVDPVREVLEAIAENSDGSPRQALVLLDKVIESMDDVEEALQMIQSSDSEENRQAIELARALINPKTTWKDITILLKGIKEDPEKLRWMVLGYASSVMLGGGKNSAKMATIIESFGDNYFDTKRAGLILSCWDVLQSK